jgi:hypothetical protein
VNADQLSEIVHLATRLQSAGMLHNAALRDFRVGDPIEPIKRDAASIAALTEKLAFKVGQLQASVASEVRRPRLEEYVTLGRAKPEAERLELSGMLAYHEGSEHD